jgi:hypothetical protein
MKLLIYNQDLEPVEQNIKTYLDLEFQSKYIESLSVFPDEDYRWELKMFDSNVILDTREKKKEILTLLRLIKRYIG